MNERIKMKPIDFLTHGEHSKNITNRICNGCGREAGVFKDELSVQEYAISGFCQKCQDSVFKGGKS